MFDDGLIEVLRSTRELILRGWIQDCYAADDLGEEVDVTSISARRFCLVGAVARAAWAYTKAPGLVRRRAIFAIRAELGMIGQSLIDGRDVEDWNDSPMRRKGDVLGLLDRAISRAQARRFIIDAQITAKGDTSTREGWPYTPAPSASAAAAAFDSADFGPYPELALAANGLRSSAARAGSG